MNFKYYDVIIVGSGIAGLYTALNLDIDLRVLVITKCPLDVCNTALAQGGVAAVLDDENDSFILHVNDTMTAGGYENDPDIVEILVEEGPQNIYNLQGLGVKFDTNNTGSLALGLEGGHSRNRIAHHKDSSGYEILMSLIKAVKSKQNITLIEKAQLLRLIKEGDYFLADVLKNNDHLYYTTKRCVLATGGIGRVYDNTTNSSAATGDGIYFAYTMGADIKNLSYIQFHPTAFADKNNRECFLISEAVRGEGAYLLNCNKERFMGNYEPRRKELAPRDIVSKCILKEQEKTGSRDFYIDISHKDSEFVKNRFPMIYSRLLEMDFDLTKEPVPVYPCQHYLMGGITVDKNGRSTIDGLYAAGECSHTGVHGNNRLASNSLLEALVFSRRIAKDINGNKHTENRDSIAFADYPKPSGKEAPEGIRSEIRGILQRAFFVLPDYEQVEIGLRRVSELKDMLEIGNYALTPDFVEIKALVTIAFIILTEVDAKKHADE